MGKPRTERETRNRLLAICAAAAILATALLLFMSVNSQRVISQTNEYLETSANQTARRINDVFDGALSNLRGAAKICERALKDEDISAEDVIADYASSQFDNTFYVTADGTAYNGGGVIADASDRLYYQAGMQGESGVCFVENALFDGNNILAFYAPVYDGDNVTGVLVAVLHEDTLVGAMTTEFYGQTTPTYLCTADGTVVAQADPTREDAENISEVFVDKEFDGASINDLVEATSAGAAADFTYRTSEGTGNTFLIKLPSYDWVLVRSFPSAITNSMISEANASGVIVIIGMLIASVVVIAVFLLQARAKNQELLLERQEANRIIDVSTNLFNNLLSINLVDGTYELLKNDNAESSLPARGSYRDLRAHFKAQIDSSASDAPAALFLDESDARKALRSGEPYVKNEWRTTDEAGGRWLQSSTLCLNRDAEGEPISLLVAVQDITSAKEREIASRIALEDAFRAAEHASRAKSDFLNSMSHDIRTPMNSIMGLTAIASMHADDPDRVHECLNNITAASKHLLGLINEVLDMAKIESGTIGLADEPFNLSESVESLISIMNPQIASKGQELKVELTDIKHEHVIGDPTRLQQVFVNIMGNSVKFTPEGGTIGLRIAELPSRIPECGCYEFTFSDTGCGMSEEFLKVIFEPFARAHDSRTTKVEGTGLGMAIVKSVVSLMSGTVDVTSKEGEGTTFTVVVHLKLRDGGREDLSDLQGVRVLVVDDEEAACEGACMLLENIGMRSAFALSGQEGIDAVQAAEADDDPFRAIILDWRMPQMSGLEAAKRIRQVVTKSVPIIILSAYDWSVIEQEAREVGVDAFISKPLFRSRLVRVMQEVLSGKTADAIDERAILEGLAFSGRRVLLTEDNMMAAAIAQELIGMTGAVVEHAENGQIAVDMLLDRDPGYYDIVLMDIQMPVMDGYEASSAIRAAAVARPDLAEIPIVALSADAFVEDIRHAHASGMNDHMAKPLDIESLARMLSKWMPR
ncbi:hybrid sensor histidine kinase/response regulator [Adlercreutzia sp. ZJ242]|uniref:hybrid sensor histidine kinase/response regulator n=1 Tax=Adlercreutzia sp. ZJ242 TaxID=2709409 RepID=UPI0013ED978F|nr:hybrid sensor histidine kinase/response regulator [Adlercreutzia sp. ZJ242]